VVDEVVELVVDEVVLEVVEEVVVEEEFIVPLNSTHGQ
jgi:hypothetical protein